MVWIELSPPLDHCYTKPMKSNKEVIERNWALVVVASILIIIGLALLVLAIINVGTFGWWSLALILGALTTIAAAVMSIVKNDPVWILLDLIIPG